MDTPAFLRKFPRAATLNDGQQVTIRPLQSNDDTALHQFFVRVPEEDRFYLNNDVTSLEVIRGFTDNISLDVAIPLVAVSGDKIVADSTLHRSRRASRRHVGELRIVVDTDYRGRGLGARLIDELIQLGVDLGLERLAFELVDRREMPAIQAAKAAGFEEVAVLEGRVRDMYGIMQALVILELPLEEEDPPHLDF
ncbi:MAG: GNAT family N-acetyltransferase [Chloroflexi bacterium]|nr:GNAT family N-acetyltransferase [Chloroflexota bacterium]